MLNVAQPAFATTAIVAMTYQFAVLNVDPYTRKGRFFSFFTIQSDILAVAALFSSWPCPASAEHRSSTAPAARPSSSTALR